jgi:dTDP-glucose 4,6-dehydratase
MKLLITGGAGFIGSNFVHFWHKNHPDDSIVVLDKLTYAGNLNNLSSIIKDIEFIEGDITDPEIVRKAMTGVDTVVHFAAESHVDRSIADPYVFTKSNVLGTHVLLETARQLNISRFHHISTDEVFGDIPLDEDWKFTETTPYNPRSPYASSKASSDHLVRAYFETYKLPITISNCTNNFGPYHHPEKFIPRSIIRLLNGQNIPIYTPGNQIRDWLYVGDHCRAIELILQKGKIGETYGIGGMTKQISNLEVAKLILKLMNLPEDRIELVTDRPGHDVKYAVDWSKIHNELGWKPEYEFEEWLKQTIEWYKHNEAWWKPLASESEAFYQNKGEQVLTK